MFNELRCEYVIKKGVNISKTCNKIKCKKHKKNNFKFFKDLPDDIYHIIISYIENDFTTIKNLSYTCEIFNEIMQFYFEKMYKGLNVQNKYFNKSNLNYKNKLCLLLEIGCQRCKTSRIRKIYYPFLYRMCKNCIQKITIDENMIREKYNIDVTRLKFNYITINLYSKPILKFYLISDIKNYLFYY